MEISTYEDIYRKLKRCFQRSFGDGKRQGLISMDEVRTLVSKRRKPDYKNNMPGNSLIEIPQNLYEELKETYISRDSTFVNGLIGCAEPTEQLDGIINMALLMYLSNHLAKQYKFKAFDEKDSTKREIFEKNENTLLLWKDQALTNIIAAIYVLSKTSEEYSDAFSYGNRIDDNKNSTFVIDLHYIGQLCVHFGWEDNKNNIIKNAQDMVKSILEKKLELGQITEEQREQIQSELDREGVLPEYEGKLCEYVGAMPLEHIGKKANAYRKMIGTKVPEEITDEDIQKLVKAGLNERELYYLFIKLGAHKPLLKKISRVKEKINLHSIEKATDDITMEEFNGAFQDLNDLSRDSQKEINPNIKT